MKTFVSYALAIALLLCLPSLALARGNKASGNKAFGGKVTAIDAGAGSITVTKHKTGEQRTFKSSGAIITVDGVSGNLSNITLGMHAKITIGSSPDIATSIVAMTHKKREAKEKAAA